MMDKLVKSEVYRFLFENSNDALLLTNPDGHVYRANPAACEMFQRSEEEICTLGRSGLVDLSDPRLAPALEERATKGRVRAELNFIRKDSSVFPTECASAIFQDEIGDIWTVIILRDMTSIKAAEDASRRAQEESNYFAMYDYLTGTLNRRAFMSKLHEELSRSRREADPFSILLLDIDHFKRINDTMSHACGDEVLKTVASLLGEKLRPYDTLGRYGGDEFIILLPKTTKQIAQEIGERLRFHIVSSRMKCDHIPISVSISVGLACCDNAPDEEVDALIKRADKNLYLAKQKRNTVFGP